MTKEEAEKAIARIHSSKRIRAVTVGLLKLLDNSQVEVDNDGQIVIYTGVKVL